MPPLFFDPERVEIVEIPDTSNEPQQSLEKILPLAQLLVEKEFPYTYGDFPRVPVREWDQDRTKLLGSIVAEELAAQSPPVPFSQAVVTRLHILGLSPPPSYFNKHKFFGGWRAFKKEIGADPHIDIRDEQRNAEYDTLSLDELTSLLLERYNDLIEMPDGEKYDGPLSVRIVEAMNRMGLAPGRNYLWRRFGGLQAINDHLGYPDVSLWDEHDFIQYGATVLRYNGAAALNKRDINLLSKNKFGPEYRRILSRFSLEDFKRLSQEELQRQIAAEDTHRQKVLLHYASLPLEAAVEEPTSFIEMAQHRALHLIYARYCNGQSPKLPSRVNAGHVRGTINAILQKYPQLSLADIETTAIEMDIFDDLWPMNHPQRLPILANCKRK